MAVKLAIIFYSTYGTNHQMASIAAEAAKTTNAEVRLLKVAETAPEEVVAGQEAWKAQADKVANIPTATVEDMEWANAYLFLAPTRFGVMASQMRAFIDTLGGVWSKGGLADKAVSAMSSAQNRHGGQEATLLSFYTSMFHWGAIVVTPGYTDPSIFKVGGNPYGYSHTQGEEFTEDVKTAISHQTRRLIDVAEKISG
ncbi:NAD(P)H:quinone oxidoreductase [Pusillimonas sp. ANT_WB101]|uniref:NAD(P)H:quinone oxidoreductase n=1 Tax=Pusillimonas sp. ANT_WB101 TaxID=2597356 RepID=UPI0011EE5CE7|nr:NAD(P)H:quinone oxidoreductase [Pusillimonas sp. ANT_WB101]KAA0910446.1 NAD(P)H:quinone oxidoreductase [Pusillimonas sp. ANT_WB101]